MHALCQDEWIHKTRMKNDSNFDIQQISEGKDMSLWLVMTFGLLGMFENGLIAKVMIQNKQLRQNSTTFFILSLSWNDIFFDAIVIFYILTTVFDTVSQQVCVWRYIIACVFHGVSHELSLLISLERYLAITSKTTYVAAFKGNKKYIYFAGIWGISSLYFSIIMTAFPVAGTYDNCSFQDLYKDNFKIVLGMMQGIFHVLKIIIFTITTLSVFQLRRRFKKVIPSSNHSSLDTERVPRITQGTFRTLTHTAIVVGKTGLLAVTGRPQGRNGTKSNSFEPNEERLSSCSLQMEDRKEKQVDKEIFCISQHKMDDAKLPTISFKPTPGLLSKGVSNGENSISDDSVYQTRSSTKSSVNLKDSNDKSKISKHNESNENTPSLHQSMRIHDSKREVKLASALKTVIFVQLSFLVLLCPDSFVQILQLFDIDVNKASRVTKALLMLHPIINPFLYIWRLPNLRKNLFGKRTL